MHFEDSVLIDQPVEKVFDYIANPQNIPKWSGPPIEVRDVQQSMPGQLKGGDKFTLVARFLGRRFDTPSEVTAYEPNRRLSLALLHGLILPMVTYILEEVPGGTRLTQSVEAELGGFFRLVGPLLEGAGKRQAKNDLQTLKNILEA